MKPIPDFVISIVKEGGIINYINKYEDFIWDTK